MRNSAFICAACLTARCLSSPLLVRAEAVTPPAQLVESARNILEFVDDSVGLITGDPVASWIVCLYALQLAIEADEELSFSPGSAITTVYGTYINRSGSLKMLTLTSYEYMASPATHETQINCALSGDFALTYHVPYGRALQSSFSDTASGASWLQQCSDGYITSSTVVDGVVSGDSVDYLPGSVGATYALRCRPYTTNSAVTLGYSGISSYFVDFNSTSDTFALMQSGSSPNPLPSWAYTGGVLTTDRIYDYWVDTFVPYVTTTYPESAWLVTGDVPEQPTTSILPGIPSDWAGDPDIPSIPDLSLQLPDGTLPSFDGVAPFAHGVSFWWDMTDFILTRFNLKAILTVLLTIAIFVFAIVKIGGGG